MTGIDVTSEIAPLKKVLLHRPGEELLNLTPATLEELLFDDIPYLSVAQQEHDKFASLLQNEGVEVVYLEDLMAESLDKNLGLREKFIKQFLQEAGIKNDEYLDVLYDWLDSNYKSNKDLVAKTMAGININEIDVPVNEFRSLDYMVADTATLIVDPMPNLYFTRDPFATIGNGVSINRMFSATRNRETIYGDYIFKYHPDYVGTKRYFKRDWSFHIEGGDILNINEETLAIGISQRTQAGAIDIIARQIFESESPIKTILAFKIPISRAFMHLDTVFTQIDYDKFTIHPGILGPLTVYEITAGTGKDISIRECHETLEETLSKYTGNKVDLILCGAGDAIAADREQWNDGSNTLCICPGTVVVYERNNVTNAELEARGLNVIKMPSAELSRGRGGPRCMSMPLVREHL